MATLLAYALPIHFKIRPKAGARGPTGRYADGMFIKDLLQELLTAARCTRGRPAVPATFQKMGEKRAGMFGGDLSLKWIFTLLLFSSLVMGGACLFQKAPTAPPQGPELEDDGFLIRLSCDCLSTNTIFFDYFCVVPRREYRWTFPKPEDVRAGMLRLFSGNRDNQLRCNKC